MHPTVVDLHVKPLFVCTVPCEGDPSVSLPLGLALLDNFVSPEEEASLLAVVDWSSGGDDVTGELLLWVFPGCPCLLSDRLTSV